MQYTFMQILTLNYTPNFCPKIDISLTFASLYRIRFCTLHFKSLRKDLHMRYMENRYHKVVGLDPVLTGQKKCGGPRSGPTLIHIGTKTAVLITEIKTQEYHVNLHLLLIFLISMIPHFGISENNHLCCGFLKN